MRVKATTKTKYKSGAFKILRFSFKSCVILKTAVSSYSHILRKTDEIVKIYELLSGRFAQGLPKASTKGRDCLWNILSPASFLF